MKRLILALFGVIPFLAACGLGGGPYHKKDGSWYFEDIRLRVPDGETVTPLNKRFAKTKTLVFFRSWALDGADPATFVALSEDYGKDATHVWFGDTYRDGQEYFAWAHTRVVELEGADPASLVSLDTPHAENDLGYVKDKARVWFMGQQMRVGDVASFGPLSYGYARDNTTGYYMREPVPGSDGKSFTNVGNEWAKDAMHVWWSDVDLRSEPSGALINRLAEGADPATFEALDHGYGKDKAHVFFQGAPLDGADPASFISEFSTGDATDAHDAKGSWKEGERVATPPPPAPASPAPAKS